MILDPRAVARALGGVVSGRMSWRRVRVTAVQTAQFSIKIEPTAPEGFVVYSFAGEFAVCVPRPCASGARARSGATRKAIRAAVVAANHRRARR